MKKLLVIVVLILSFMSHAKAQENSNGTDNSSNTADNRKKVQFGIKAGINSSNVYDKSGDGFSTNPKLGFVGGIFADIPFGYYFGIQPSLLFSQSGFEGSGIMYGSSYNLTRTTNFLAFPVLFLFKPSEFITILAGPQYSYLMKQNNDFSSPTTAAQEQQFANDDPRKNIFGVVLGVDINFKHITIGARMNWDAQSNNLHPTTYTPSYKNLWFQATLGYKFYQK